MEDAHKIIKNSKNRSVQTFGFVYHDFNGLNHGSSMEDPVVPLERNLYGHPLAGLLWERQFEKVLLQKLLGTSSELGMFIVIQNEKTILIFCMWTISKMTSKTENMDPT